MSREALTAGIADILLADGVATLPLRELAVRLNTSDRMLLYYFDNKSALIEASIAALAARLDELLSTVTRAPDRLTPVDLLRETAGLMAVPGMAAFRMVWADILARGGRGEAPFASIAHALVQGSLASLEAKLAIGDATRRRRVAASILAVIEGMWLVGMVAPGSTDGTLDIMIERFAGSWSDTGSD